MILSIALAAALAATPSTDQLRNIRGLLSPIEEGPRYEAIRQIPNAREALEVIARDGATAMVIRGRALEGIASFKDDAAFARVSAAVDDPTLPVIVRRIALMGLGIQFQERSLAVVERVLAHSADQQTRRMAAMTLSRVHASAALDIARNAQLVEQDEVVRNDLAASVASLQSQPAQRRIFLPPYHVVAPRTSK